ncbi:marvel domain-containing protein [Aspergillus spinulosporus]
MAETNPIDYIVRGLQLVFAIIVMGTDGYAIHVFRGYDDHVNNPVFGGDATLHVGVPAAWGFLMFCAAWTVLVVVFHFVEPGFASRPIIDYVGIVAEAVGVLLWLAGFIAVAVNVATTDACSSGKNSCAELKGATVFGVFEWLLFMVTATPAVMSFFNNQKRVTSS